MTLIHSVLLFATTRFRNSIQDETQFSYQRRLHSRVTVSRVDFSYTPAVSFTADSDVDAKRRRERHLRSWLRHMRLTVAMELSAALHHSRGVGPLPHATTEASTQTVDHAAPAQVVEYTSPAPAVNAAFAPVNEYVAPELVLTNLACLQETSVPIVHVVQVPHAHEKIFEAPEILLF